MPKLCASFRTPAAANESQLNPEQGGPVDLSEHARFAAKLKGVRPEER